MILMKRSSTVHDDPHNKTQLITIEYLCCASVEQIAEGYKDFYCPLHNQNIEYPLVSDR